MSRLSDVKLDASRCLGGNPRSPDDSARRHPGRDALLATHVGLNSVEISRHLSSLGKLGGVLLLGGTVRASALRASIQRSIFDLPVDQNHSILSCWLEQCAALADSLKISPLPVRLILDRASHRPEVFATGQRQIQFSIERDPFEFRGTGGLLRDLAAPYADDHYLLVANAVQLLRSPLPVIAADLATQSAAAVVISHADGTPSGVMLVRCGCLRDLPAVGFVDMKEQGLELIAKRHDVKVVERSQPTGLPVRTYVNYLAALREHHRDGLAGEFNLGCEKWEDWKRAFAIIEKGATVAPGARIHDSVVLRGARVEGNAVIINSVVSAGGHVRSGQIVADELVKSAGRG